MTTVIDPKDLKSLSSKLIQQVTEFKTANNYSDDDLGRMVGASGSQIYKATHAKFVGNLESLESKILDVLKNEPIRRKVSAELCQNVFANNMHNFFQTVQRTDDFGLAYSPAGKGKTSSMHLYLAKNSLAIGITLHKGGGNAGSMVHLFFREINAKGFNRNKGLSRWEFLVKRFRHSHRLIIIDNAQRLARSGREWLLDFHDETECPVALVGNPEVLDYFRQCDQHFSRIGLNREIKGGSPQEDAAFLVKQFWPESEGKLGKLPLQVIKEEGHLRALKKQLLLAREISGGSCDDPITAFKAAHTQLIRDYKLVDE